MAKKKRDYAARIYANMNWFSVAEQPSDAKHLPSAFAQAHKLWKKDAEKNLGKIVNLLQPFLRANLVLENLANYQSLFDTASANEQHEIQSENVTLVGVDFSDGPIPKCKAETIFEVGLSKNPKRLDLDQWQDENSYLYDAVSFSWDVPRTAETEGMDFTFGDNSGVEAFIIDETARLPEKEIDENSEVRDDCATVNIAGMSAAEREELLGFLKEHWSEEVANMAEIESMPKGDWNLTVRGGMHVLLSRAIEGMLGSKVSVTIIAD